jgi:3-oxoadipate enol-lactonase
MPYVTSHGTNIYYEVHGTAKPTLILAHGMGGNAAIWFNQLADFVADYRVIIFDHRYFARSACAAADFKPAWFADDVLAIMDAEDIATATFICQSMGGWTGSQMALQHPARVERLVMSHTPGIFTHASADNDVATVAASISAPSTSGPSASAFSSPALAADYPAKNPAGAVLYQQISSFNGVDPAVIPRSIGAARLGINTDDLGDYAIPTLFISADKDSLFPAPYIQALAATLPGAQFINLGDAGHSSYFELPAAFNAAVRGFIH